MSPIEIKTGDFVCMRKKHPCGSYEWLVTRTGADIGMKCIKCGRRVLLARDEFERRVKSIRPAGLEAADWKKTT